MAIRSKSFWGVALITVSLSILWTGLSRAFSVFVPAKYNTMFADANTIFWHVLAPMALTYLVFFLLMRRMERLGQVYQQQPLIAHRGVRILFAIIVIAMILFSLFNLYQHLHAILNHWHHNSLARLLFAFMSTFFVGLLEESVFRGFALTEFRRRFNEPISCLLSLILFGFWHLPNIIAGAPVIQASLQVFSTMIIGFGLYMAVRLSRSIWGGVLMHWLWDFALVIAH